MIREALDSDISRIAEIQHAAWHSSYSGILPRNIMKQSDLSSFVLLWQGRFDVGDHDVCLCLNEQDTWIAGFFRISVAEELDSALPDFGELTHLYVDPANTIKGIGHELYTAALNRIKLRSYNGVYLWTLEHNERARKFYEKHDMTADGKRRNPASLGEGVFEVRYVLAFN